MQPKDAERPLAAAPLLVAGPKHPSRRQAPSGPAAVGVQGPDHDADSHSDEDDPPTGANDVATVAEDSDPTSIDVLANDSDSDGGPLTIEAATQPAHGTVQVTGGGSGLTYEPDPDYCNDPGGEADEFEYTIAPGGSTATVAVMVTCEDEPIVYTAKYWELRAKYERFEIGPGVYPYHPECMEAWEREEPIICAAVIVFLYPDGTLSPLS